MKFVRSRRLFAAVAVALLAAAPAASRAAVQIDASISYEAAHAPRLDIDVWTNKEEGGVYRQGEGMRVFFRPSADAYVLIYNIDTEDTSTSSTPTTRTTPTGSKGDAPIRSPRGMTRTTWWPTDPPGSSTSWRSLRPSRSGICPGT